MTEPRIVYADFDPVNIACYDCERNVIVIDRKLRNNIYEDYLIEHEQKHAKSQKLIDWFLELFERKPKGFAREMLRIKPLHVFSSFWPFVIYRSKGKTYTGIEFFRVMILMFFVLYGYGLWSLLNF